MVRIESTGTRKPGKLARFLQRLVGRINSLHTVVDVKEDEYRYRFLCPNDQTLRRATTLLIKEKGTIEWLRQQAQSGKVFLDIGANVGIYSIYAGHRLGARGRVYAVEPHLRNASALIDNVVANGLSERINVMAVALADKPGMLDFCYRDWDTGSSHSQLSVGENRRAYEAVARELKSACSVRQLIDDGVMQPPDFVKIDVDGIELDILHGMKSTLMGEERPTSVQVECDPANWQAIDDFMRSVSYGLDRRHATMAGEKHLVGGADIVEIPHNAIYAPVE